ncbi:MAG TPA: pirin family protein [Casimicrobiaceae bacterium]|nr:pirin family protein [Casimicrobiaceae bacterium]
MKKISSIHTDAQQHWVGDGFPVRTLFSYSTLGKEASPFLMLDYAAPTTFDITKRQRGVGQHPHRGFETVTIVYEGELEHRDSTGSGGRIGKGDVQWMTAGSGIMHEEFHSRDFASRGGTLQMAQLWVNLPAEDKMTPPSYQSILDADIPSVKLADDAGSVRVIAGEYAGHQGPARTFTPIDVWDLRLSAGAEVTLPLQEGRSAILVVLRGTVMVNDEAIIREAQMMVLDRAGSDASLSANNDTTVLVLSGEPIDEPIAGYGPFVMNSQQEIAQAIEDFNGGRFGKMPPLAR